MILNINIKKFRAASYFMADGDVRHYLNGILVEVVDNQMRLVATNGAALFVAKSCTQSADVSFIIPVIAVKEILRHKTFYDTFELTIPDDLSREFRANVSGNIVIFIKVDGKFPDYRFLFREALASTPIEQKHFHPSDLELVTNADIALSKDKKKPKRGFVRAIKQCERMDIHIIDADCMAVLSNTRTNFDPLPELYNWILL